MSSKRYPEEFKIEAVRQVTDRGHSVAQVSSRLGVTTHSLYAWLRKYGPDSAQHQAASDDQGQPSRTRLPVFRLPMKIHNGNNQQVSGFL